MRIPIWKYVCLHVKMCMVYVLPPNIWNTLNPDENRLCYVYISGGSIRKAVHRFFWIANITLGKHRSYRLEVVSPQNSNQVYMAGNQTVCFDIYRSQGIWPQLYVCWKPRLVITSNSPHNGNPFFLAQRTAPRLAISANPRSRLARIPNAKRWRTFWVAVLLCTIFFILIHLFTASSSIHVAWTLQFKFDALTSIVRWCSKWNFGRSLKRNFFCWTASAARAA